MNRFSPRIGMLVAVAVLSALLISTTGTASAAKPPGKNGVIHACFKAKGKNKGALRVVAGKRACKRMRGWRALSWSATGLPGQDARADLGQQGPQGSPGAAGNPGEQRTAGQVEKSLLETIQSQSAQIDTLNKQVAALSGEVFSLGGNVSTLTGDLGDLEDTVGETCDQLEVLTDQTDDIVTGVSGVELNNALELIGGLVTFPGLPGTLGTFECS